MPTLTVIPARKGPAAYVKADQTVKVFNQHAQWPSRWHLSFLHHQSQGIHVNGTYPSSSPSHHPQNWQLDAYEPTSAYSDDLRG